MHATDNPLGLEAFDVAEFLDSEELIAEFLNSVIADEDPDLFVSAVGAVARARGMASVASDAGLSRESLYKVFKEGAQPRFETVYRIMLALNVEFQARPRAAAMMVSERLPADSYASAPAKRRHGSASAGGGVRARLSALSPTESDIGDAVAWSRGKSPK